MRHVPSQSAINAILSNYMQTGAELIDASAVMECAVNETITMPCEIPPLSKSKQFTVDTAGTYTVRITRMSASS